MNIYRRYFRVTGGPLVEAVRKAAQVNSAAHSEYQKILAEIGANPAYYQRRQKLVGIIFDTKPDSGIFMRSKGGGWYPKKNCSAGKKLAARIEAVKTIDPQSALKAVGLSDRPTIFFDSKCYWPTLTIIPEASPVVYVSVPWFDADPEKLKQYKSDRAAGICGYANYDAVLWQPTAEMAEIKNWEVDRHIDEWNEKVESGKATQR